MSDDDNVIDPLEEEEEDEVMDDDDATVPIDDLIDAEDSDEELEGFGADDSI